MNKHTVLLAILLPFGSHGISKEARMIEIDSVAHDLIWDAMRQWMYVLCTYKNTDLSQIPAEKREWFWKKMEEFKNKMTELDKEYKELEVSCKEQ